MNILKEKDKVKLLKDKKIVDTFRRCLGYIPNIITLEHLAQLNLLTQEEKEEKTFFEYLCKVVSIEEDTQEVKLIDNLKRITDSCSLFSDIKKELKKKYTFANYPISYRDMRIEGNHRYVADNILLTGIFFNQYMQVIPNVCCITNFSPKNRVYSKLVASLTGIPEIPFEEKCISLGYTKTAVKKLLLKVKKKQKNLALIGLGGMNFNVLQNLNELALYANTYNIFNKVKVYENDTLEFSNIFRFNLPNIPIESKFPRTKTELLLTSLNYKAVSNIVYTASPHYFTVDTSTEMHYSYIGAPDLKTREEIFSFSNIQFYSLTHQGNSVYMHYRPKVEASLLTETYGSIDVPRFLHNTLKVTLTLLEQLAKDEVPQEDSLLLAHTFNEDFLEVNTKKKYKMI